MRVLKAFIAAVAVLLVGVVAVGFALPGTWDARREATVPVPVDSVFPLLDSVEGWASWAPLGAVEGTRSGPDRGAGASFRWDDPEWGQGEWTLTEAERLRHVAYEVRVEDGSLVTRGDITLESVEGGTRIRWQETGDFGWNPVLAYVALAMDRLQGREMEKSLATLRDRWAPAPLP